MTEHKYVPAMGNPYAKLMILGESPSYKEVEKGEPFVGPSGEELNSLLKAAGINRADTWVSNVCKYFVPPNREGEKVPFRSRAFLHGINMEEQLEHLQNEINDLRPNCILALGGTALWAMNGRKEIGSFRGSILYARGVKFVPTYHPAHLLHQSSGAEFKGYWNRQVMKFDFKRANEESKYAEYTPPNRNLQICKTASQLYDYIHRHRNQKRMSVDIEAGGSCHPICIGFAHHPSEGLCVPLWNCDGISSMSDTELAQIWTMVADLLHTKSIVGQNFNYDRDKLQRIGFGIRHFVSDLMLKAFAINPELPKSLAFNTSIYTREPFYKDEGMYEGSLHDLMIGCARDACVTIEIDAAMDNDLDEMNQRPFFENFLMKLPDLYLDIERTGFPINYEKRDELLKKYIKMDERNTYRLHQLTGETVNVDGKKQIPHLLFDVLGLPKKPTCGEEDLTALIQSPTMAKKTREKEIIERILEGRRIKRTISHNIMALPDFDGRMKTTYFPCLETGRTSTSQQGPPIRPTIELRDEKKKLIHKKLGTPFQTMTKHGDIGSDIREMYEAYPDEVLVNADSEQAEARVVWLLADDEEALELVDKIDYHALTATWFFGENQELKNYDKKLLGYEHPIRFAGKTLRHAGHLGAGKRRASIEVNTQARKYGVPIQISEALAGTALGIFHAKQPKIQRVFQAKIEEALQRNRTLIAPVPYGVDAEFGGTRIFYERYGEELFRQGFSYIPQRAVSDNTKAAALRIKEKIPNIKIIMEAHDALLFSIPKAKVTEYCGIIKEEMQRPIRFSTCTIPRRDLVIPCGIEVGPNYYSLRKYKIGEEYAA